MNESIYHAPTINLLESETAITQDVDFVKLEEQKKHIIDVLRAFCIPIDEIRCTLGSSIVRYEIKPRSGQLYAKVRKNERDIALCLSPMGVRIISPIPGRNLMAIEMENPTPSMLLLKDVIGSDSFKSETMDLPCAIGKQLEMKCSCLIWQKCPICLSEELRGKVNPCVCMISSCRCYSRSHLKN